MSLTSLETTRRTVDAYASQQAKIVATLLRIQYLLWGRLPDRNDRDMVRAFAARTAVDVDIALEQIRGLARTYSMTRLAQLDAMPDRMPDLEDTYARSGVPIVEVYQRPVREARFIDRAERAKGTAPEVAVEKAQAAFEERLTRAVEDDAAATARNESLKVLAASPKAIGYRRIIHPERSRTGVCGLCVVAATRMYSLEELMPLHDLCKCTVDAVTATADPGLALNEEDMRQIVDPLYANAGGTTSGEALKNIRITTVEHGELGPILIRQGNKFRTFEEANANRRNFSDPNRQTKYTRLSTPYSKPTPAENRTNWQAMAATSERSIRYLQNARSRGSDMVDLGTGRPTKVTDIDAAIQYHRDLIARARRHAA